MASTSKRKTGRSNPRKSHRKSRLGCVECKRRRIKCDEGKPSCSFCISRAVRCRFPTAPLSNQDSPAASTNSPQLSTHGMQSIPAQDCVASIEKSNRAAFSMDLQDTILFHHYCTFTCSTFGRSKDTQDFWRCAVVEVGFDHPFLLHAILSVSALHMAHLKENTDYLAKANERWDVALRSATSLLSDISEHNCHALYVFAMLSCFQTLARGPKPGNFLLFGNGDNAEWLIFFRGLRSISQVFSVDSVHRGAAAIIWSTALQNFEFSPASDPALEPEPIADLRQLLAGHMAGDSDWPIYITTLNQLSMCFSIVFDGSQTHAPTHAKDVFAWMHNISDHFILRLQQHQPAALTLFAYFVVLIKQMERGWMMHGWSSHLLSGIYDVMEPSKTLWLRWPMENVGWLPSS